MLNSTLKSSVSRLWDKFWSGGISNPLTAIEQISYLLFMKRLDEMDNKLRQDSEFTGEDYKSIFEGQDENLKWSNFKQMEGGVMLEHMQLKVFPFVKSLGKEGGSFAKYMKNAVFIISKPSLLVEAVGIIDEIFDEIARQQSEGQNFQDTQGDVYEYLLSELKSAGKLGQFRTPRHIIQLICELVDPKLGDTVCDPACGTGGFLLGAYQHIITAHTSKENKQKDENGIIRGSLGDLLTDDRQWKHLKENTFYGFDMDESMVRIGLMNLMMHGISSPNIEQKDTLSKKYDENNLYDVIIANPPFKGSIDKGDINESLSVNTTKTELLFVNRIINSLKIGGIGAVIVPEGVITGDLQASKDIRKMLIEKTQLVSVISMPHFIFKPYASVSTAILVFIKGGTTEDIWMYKLKCDGYSSGNTRDYTGETDIPELLASWKEKSKQSYTPVKGRHSYVSRKQVVEQDYDLSCKKYLDGPVIDTDNYNFVKLGEISDVTKGTEPASGEETGDYPLITTAKDFKLCANYTNDSEAILIPLVSSTGHGHASIKRLAYYKGKFSAAKIVGIVEVTDARFLPKFIYYYLLAFKEELLVSKMKGSANVSLSLTKIKDVKIPVLLMHEQEALIERLESLDSEIKELQERIMELDHNSDKELIAFREEFGKSS
jgi:type I restriction enzyme M protein